MERKDWQSRTQARKAQDKKTHRDTTLRRFAARLRYLREQRGFSQEDLAKRAKIQQHHVSSLERSESMPSLLTVELLASAFEMELSEFLAFPVVGTRESDRVDEEVALVARALKKLDFETIKRLRKVIESFV